MCIEYTAYMVRRYRKINSTTVLIGGAVVIIGRGRQEWKARNTRDKFDALSIVNCGREAILDGVREIAIFLVCNARQYARR